MAPCAAALGCGSAASALRARPLPALAPPSLAPLVVHRRIATLPPRAKGVRAASSAGDAGSRTPKQPKQQRQDRGDNYDEGPSTSGASLDMPSGSGPPAEPPPTPVPWLIEWLRSRNAPTWLVSFIAAYIIPPSTARTAPLARALWITVGLVVAALGRELLFPSPRTIPRELLYSDFVTLLENGRVRAARLEAGTSRLYFDVRPAAAAAAAAAATPTAAAPAPAASNSGAGVGATEAAAVTGAASASASPSLATAASTSAAATSSPSTSGAPVAAAPAAAAPAAAAAAMRQRFQKQFYIKLADKHDSPLITRVMQAGVEYGVLRASVQAAAAQAFLTAVALWVPLLPLLWVLRRLMDARSGASGRTKKATAAGSTPSTTFADVAGVDAAKEELLEVVSVMRQSKATYSRLKVKMPSGVLLCGPPGTGKTLLAKAVAGEAGVPFFSVAASEFVELYVGRGAARIRELFAEARKAAPCVVFVDELDGVGSRRGMGYNDERDQTLNQLLTELDGFDGRPGVLFLAATNRIDVLDPALLRPGRISRKVVVPLPDEPGRAQILAVHMRGVPLEDGLSAQRAREAAAAATPGFSGAELANVVNEAKLLAARESRDTVGLRDLLLGAQRTRFGVNGRSGANAFGGAFTQRLQQWLLDVAAAADRRPVKVGSGSGG